MRWAIIIFIYQVKMRFSLKSHGHTARDGHCQGGVRGRKDVEGSLREDLLGTPVGGTGAVAARDAE